MIPCYLARCRLRMERRSTMLTASLRRSRRRRLVDRSPWTATGEFEFANERCSHYQRISRSTEPRAHFISRHDEANRSGLQPGLQVLLLSCEGTSLSKKYKPEDAARNAGALHPPEHRG